MRSTFCYATPLLTHLDRDGPRIGLWIVGVLPIASPIAIMLGWPSSKVTAHKNLRLQLRPVDASDHVSKLLALSDGGDTKTHGYDRRLVFRIREHMASSHKASFQEELT